jgi:glycosyltransferase involved in cell wall biosynthesis
MAANFPEAGQTAVTVIVCCYNAAETVRESLQSVLAQSHPVIQVLVIDDGSTDDSASVVQQIAASASNVRLLRNDRNRGTAYTRMRGLQEATTEFVMFFDSDDRADPRLVALLLEKALTDRNILGVACHARYFGERGTLGIQKIGPTSADEFFSLYHAHKLIFVVPVTLFRRSIALQVGGYRTALLPNAAGIRYEDFSEDLDLWCRMSDLGAQGMYFVTLPIPLFWYRKPSNSVSTRNVSLMQLKMRWIKDCLVRRRSGAPERSLGEYLASRTWMERINDLRSDYAAMCYKKAGFAYSRRQFARLVLFLGAAGLLSPKLIVQKIATQRAAYGS